MNTVLVDAGGLQDLSGKAYAGASDITDFDFSTLISARMDFVVI